ncbi:HHIP-like protein 1 [Argonauta hians]
MVFIILTFQLVLVYSTSLKEQYWCICLKEIQTNGLRKPVAFISINKESFLVAEQDGKIYYFIDRHRNTNTYNESKEEWRHILPRKKLLLDLSNRVAYDNERPAEERGLMSIAAHPLFERNKKLFVYYIAVGEELAVISQFRLSDNHLENGISEEIILMIPRQRRSRENGGQILFGTDGFLYVSVGSGFGHWTHLAQNKSSLIGKILRLDVDVALSNRLYSIPTDNPFVNLSDARPEIYALGIKNSWRCSVDRGDSLTGSGRGRMFCGDVGDQMFEEINIIHKGGNYGWNYREGYRCRHNIDCTLDTIHNEILPIATYKHSYDRKVVIGGYVYRGSKIPLLNGKFIFADFLSIDLFSLSEEAPNHWSESRLKYCDNTALCNPSANIKQRQQQYILSFGQDVQGELYVLSVSNLFSQQSSGHIYKIEIKMKDGSEQLCASLIDLSFIIFLVLITTTNLIH